jgi:hypothetical protein
MRMGKKTLVVARGEDDDPGVVPDDALGDPHLRLLALPVAGGLDGDGLGAEDLEEEVVALAAGAELLHLAQRGLHRRSLACLPDSTGRGGDLPSPVDLVGELRSDMWIESSCDLVRRGGGSDVTPDN